MKRKFDMSLCFVLSELVMAGHTTFLNYGKRKISSLKISTVYALIIMLPVTIARHALVYCLIKYIEQAHWNLLLVAR